MSGEGARRGRLRSRQKMDGVDSVSLDIRGVVRTVRTSLTIDRYDLTEPIAQCCGEASARGWSSRDLMAGISGGAMADLRSFRGRLNDAQQRRLGGGTDVVNSALMESRRCRRAANPRSKTSLSMSASMAHASAAATGHALAPLRMTRDLPADACSRSGGAVDPLLKLPAAASLLLTISPRCGCQRSHLR